MSNTAHIWRISQPVQIKTTGWWYVVYVSCPQKDDLYDSSGRVKRKYVIEERVFKRVGNARNYISRIKSKHQQEHFKIENIQLN